MTTEPTAPPPRRPERISYGDDPHQFGELWLPDRAGPHHVVVSIHGGFWRSKFRLDLNDPLAADLAADGAAVWNIEYRRVGNDGGGVPGTLDDVRAAVDALAEISTTRPLDVANVGVLGHSAGGHLAMWLATRPELSVGLGTIVSLAGVNDLYACAEAGLGEGAAQEFCGGEPTEVPDAYAAAQPDLDAVGDAILVTGTDDDRVPSDFTTRFADRFDTIVVEGEDHFDVIDPASASWRQARIHLLRR